MTKQSRFGKVNRSVKSKDIKDHVVATAKVIEEDAKDSPVKDVAYDVNKLEVHSDIFLEDDAGYGDAAIIRTFDFKVNPEVAKKGMPNKQVLFNAHAKQIEIFLMKDGLKVMPEVNPQIRYTDVGYVIVVGAKPMKGYLLQERPQTLSEIAHGKL